MATSTLVQETGPSLRPRVFDASEINYETVVSLVEIGDDAYFERKGGETNLIIR